MGGGKQKQENRVGARGPGFKTPTDLVQEGCNGRNGRTWEPSSVVRTDYRTDYHIDYMRLAALRTSHRRARPLTQRQVSGLAAAAHPLRGVGEGCHVRALTFSDYSSRSSAIGSGVTVRV